MNNNSFIPTFPDRDAEIERLCIEDYTKDGNIGNRDKELLQEETKGIQQMYREGRNITVASGSMTEEETWEDFKKHVFDL